MDYRKIGTVWCPALNDHIAFNSMGIRHLRRKRGEFRPKKEQRRRLGLLRHATSILGNPNVSITHLAKDAIHFKKKKGEKMAVKSRAYFWAFKQKFKTKTITVVVRQFEGGNKHFLSVY